MHDAPPFVREDDENEQEPGRGGRHDEEICIDSRRTMYLVTVAGETSNPSFNNSP
jgi:hypothetical protein